MDFKATAFALKLKTVKAHVGAFYDELMRNQHLSAPDLFDLQNNLAQQIAAFAMESSPYYRELYRSQGIRPEALTDRDEWAKLPILDRSTVKANSAHFRTAEATRRNTRNALTGGSTGEPLKTMHDTRIPAIALAWRMYSWWGVTPYDNIARVGRWNFSRIATLKNDISWWPSRQVYLDAALISDETMQVFHRQLNRLRPRLLEGYVGALLEFADYLERRRLTVPPPVAVATTAAPLTEPARARLESVFGAPVYDEYRGSEFGWMAGECAQQNGLHVFEDVRRIEVVDASGAPAAKGDVGDLVITDLRNRVFPVIRYRTGDRGILREAPCECGRSLALMEQPQGRVTDLIRLPSGAVVVHRLMAMFSAHPDAVRLFQIHQLKDYSITVRVVVGDRLDAHSQIETAVEALRTRINREVPVRI